MTRHTEMRSSEALSGSSARSLLSASRRYPASFVIGLSGVGMTGFIASFVAVLMKRLDSVSYAGCVSVSLGAMIIAGVTDYRRSRDSRSHRG